MFADYTWADSLWSTLSPCPLEKLNGSLVLLGRSSSLEGSEISALAGLGIFLPGVESIFTRFEFSNH
jgi:hypothetical protein